MVYINGQVYPQSTAIARYAAKLSGLYPSDAAEALEADSVIDSINDVITQISFSLRDKDPAKGQEARKAIATGSLPDLLKYVRYS